MIVRLASWVQFHCGFAGATPENWKNCSLAKPHDRFGGVMKPYVRRMFGDEMVDRHRAMKLALDPSFILNRDVVFDAPEAG